jgi:CheY-like chemotaxis protein
VEQQGGIILVVDDDEGARNLVRRILERAGHTTLTASGGLAAIRQVEALGPNVALVVLDMVMPDLDGASTFKVLREMYPTLPILICSGACKRDDVTEILTTPGCAFLAKPYAKDALLQAIAGLLPKT